VGNWFLIIKKKQTMKIYKKLLILLLVVVTINLNSAYTTKNTAAEIIVIVNKENPVESLTASEAKLYYLRKLKKRWPVINKNILPADRKKKCPEQDYFYSKVLGMSATDVEQYFVNRQLQNAERPQDKFLTEAEIINFVASEPGAIGYVSANALTPELKSRVKVVLTL
jgi:ABC-type phosphate transport system substrate-binding protein